VYTIRNHSDTHSVCAIACHWAGASADETDVHCTCLLLTAETSTGSHLEAVQKCNKHRHVLLRALGWRRPQRAPAARDAQRGARLCSLPCCHLASCLAANVREVAESGTVDDEKPHAGVASNSSKRPPRGGAGKGELSK
jgi:hypothetical protein